jgi:hypothetical protein
LVVGGWWLVGLVGLVRLVRRSLVGWGLASLLKPRTDWHTHPRTPPAAPPQPRDPLQSMMLFVVILLVGSGWLLLKQHLTEREKRVMVGVLAAQVARHCSCDFNYNVNYNFNFN